MLKQASPGLLVLAWHCHCSLKMMALPMDGAHGSDFVSIWGHPMLSLYQHASCLLRPDDYGCGDGDAVCSARRTAATTAKGLETLDTCKYWHTFITELLALMASKVLLLLKTQQACRLDEVLAVLGSSSLTSRGLLRLQGLVTPSSFAHTSDSARNTACTSSVSKKPRSMAFTQIQGSDYSRPGC